MNSREPVECSRPSRPTCLPRLRSVLTLTLTLPFAAMALNGCRATAPTVETTQSPAASPHAASLLASEPIETKGMTLQDLPALKEQVFQIIQTEISKHNNTHVNRYSDHQKISTLSQA